MLKFFVVPVQLLYHLRSTHYALILLFNELFFFLNLLVGEILVVFLVFFEFFENFKELDIVFIYDGLLFRDKFLVINIFLGDLLALFNDFD